MRAPKDSETIERVGQIDLNPVEREKVTNPLLAAMAQILPSPFGVLWETKFFPVVVLGELVRFL